MSTRLREVLAGTFGTLRHEPTQKRIRATSGDATVVDSTKAMLLWEPRRIVPSYAVPAGDVDAELVRAQSTGDAGVDAGAALPDVTTLPVLDPSVPFASHTADGETLDVRVGGRTLAGAGFRLDDPDLAGYVVLDFTAFDAWYEEDERNVAHPRDPFHRIDRVPSSRRVRLELDGAVLAESSRPTLLFETMLPPRFYLPPDDVEAELVPSDKRTYCAYKGEAAYWSVRSRGATHDDLAWTYENPLHDGAGVRGLVAFFTERVDAVLDGERLGRPVTPWSRR
ncbi:MAG TPA: DUF427 domain-containing protein [Streptosporangiales bacterium]